MKSSVGLVILVSPASLVGMTSDLVADLEMNWDSSGGMSMVFFLRVNTGADKSAFRAFISMNDPSCLITFSSPMWVAVGVDLLIPLDVIFTFCV